MPLGENMSDNATVSEGSTQTGEGQVIQTTTAPQTDADRIAALEKTNARLLNESKDYKMKLQAEKEKFEKDKKAKLEEQGKLKEVLDQERAEIAIERAQFQEFKKRNLSIHLDYEILKHAPDAQNVKLIKQSLPADLISAFEEDNTLKFTGVKEGIEKIRKEEPYLFKPQTIPQMVSGKPGTPSIQSLGNGAAKTPKQMTRDELLAYWKANPNLK